jgi:hypothetical protein
MGCLIVTLQSARAFSLAGPVGNGGDSWQILIIGYGPPRDAVAPKNLGEEYRWNIPVLNYAYDQNFLDYFGSNGVAAVDQAFAILNNTFTNGPSAVTHGLDGYSRDLSEFPLESKSVNYLAQALSLSDIKSLTLEIMTQELGLADPEFYVWTLRAREHIAPGPNCPDNMNYLVIKRNFDPVTFEPSSYVNGTLYSYSISEVCQNSAILAEAVPVSVDPLAFTYTPVASRSLGAGEFYTGLTRDDVGGLRYMLRTNNMNFESPGPNTTVFTLTTNANQTTITTSNLQTFLELLPVTDPVTLLTIYPDLNITSVSSNFVVVNITNFFGILTNAPWAPAGFPAQLIVQGQTVQQFALRYSYTFDNLVTNHFYPNWPTKIQTIQISPAPFAPAGSGLVITNSISTITTRTNGGDFYILPPGVMGYVFEPGLVITNKGSVTNIDPNSIFSVNASTIRFQQTISYFTNYQYVVHAIQLLASTNATDLFQGIQKMTFVRRDFDSLIGQTWQTVTNNYTLHSVGANSSLIPHPVRRVVTTQPDILFTARDIPPNVTGGVISPIIYSRTFNFNQNNILPNLAGPGTIEPRVTITYNKEAPVFYNTSAFLTEPAVPYLVYGSFDGTTNPPVVYPSGTSLVNLENQVLMQVTSTSLPDGNVGVAYNGGAGFQLTGSGGSPPYTWDIVANALPPGLDLSSSGLISGRPTSAATFDFTVRMTDTGARPVQRDFAITIHP